MKRKERDRKERRERGWLREVDTRIMKGIGMDGWRERAKERETENERKRD